MNNVIRIETDTDISSKDWSPEQMASEFLMEIHTEEFNPTEAVLCYVNKDGIFHYMVSGCHYSQAIGTMEIVKHMMIEAMKKG